VRSSFAVSFTKLVARLVEVAPQPLESTDGAESNPELRVGSSAISSSTTESPGTAVRLEGTMI
jgi:hypothetical protein